MTPLEYVEIENFKRFGERQRIELDHPTVPAIDAGSFRRKVDRALAGMTP